jgi:hypothetical protein
MTKRVKFDWEFICNEKDRTLTVNLNGGCNRIINFDFPDYYKLLSEVFKEISFYNYVIGNKTHVYGLEELAEVDAIRKDEPQEVIKQQVLARKGR